MILKENLKFLTIPLEINTFFLKFGGKISGFFKF